VKVPKKLLQSQAVPSLVLERLEIWGKCVHAQRVIQNIPALHLCARVGISDATLRRLEKGDPGVGGGTYLTALMVLGVLDVVAPTPDILYWSTDPRSRARSTLSGKDDDGYF
jgi:hypothetical protein